MHLQRETDEMNEKKKRNRARGERKIHPPSTVSPSPMTTETELPVFATTTSQ